MPSHGLCTARRTRHGPIAGRGTERASSRLVSYNIISYRSVSYSMISYTSSTSCVFHRSVSYHTRYHIISHIVSHHIASYNIISCRIIPCNIISRDRIALLFPFQDRWSSRGLHRLRPRDDRHQGQPAKLFPS